MIVTKPWGQETWVELNDKYCFKRIFFKAGCRCSLQYHEKKLETIYVESGEGQLWIDGNHPFALASSAVTWLDKAAGFLVSVPISAGDSFTIEPNTRHRIVAITDIVTMEVSTPEVDDCIRIADDWYRPNGRIENEYM